MCFVAPTTFLVALAFEAGHDLESAPTRLKAVRSLTLACQRFVAVQFRIIAVVPIVAQWLQLEALGLDQPLELLQAARSVTILCFPIQLAGFPAVQIDSIAVRADSFQQVAHSQSN